ncbi:MAG TPA: xanthine dehydrogenase family protein subunit M [Stellaceae bacterium]
MKPAKFDYYSPATIDEALLLLGRYQGEARVLAGGQSLVPMMNFRLATPAAIVDLNRVPGLAKVEATNGTISIGAMARQRQLEFAPLIRAQLPLLSEALRWVGHLPTRTRGTIGGSIAHADPAAEIPMVLQTMVGEVVVRGPQGERRIAAPDLFLAPLTTALGPDEILTEVRFPVTPPGAGCAIEEFARRKGDFAIAAIAVVLVRDGERCTMAHLATAGIGPVPVRLYEAEAILQEKGLGETAIAEATQRAAELVEPMADHNASADFRRHLTGVLTRRAVVKARDRRDVRTG